MLLHTVAPTWSLTSGGEAAFAHRARCPCLSASIRGELLLLLLDEVICRRRPVVSFTRLVRLLDELFADPGSKALHCPVLYDSQLVPKRLFGLILTAEECSHKQV